MWIWVGFFRSLLRVFLPLIFEGKTLLGKSWLTSHFHACSLPQGGTHPFKTQPSLRRPMLQPQSCQWPGGVAVAGPYLQQQGDGDAGQADAHGAEASDDEGPPAQLLDGEALPRESRDRRGGGELPTMTGTPPEPQIQLQVEGCSQWHLGVGAAPAQSSSIGAGAREEPEL